MQEPRPAELRMLARVYRRLRAFGLNDSHSGNASLRAGDWFWITPRGAMADGFRADMLVRVPVVGAIPERASSDAPLHQRVYQRVPEARSVLHVHAPHALALTLSGEPLRLLDLEGRLYFGEEVPVVEIPYERHFADAPERVSNVLTTARACIERGHGVYVWGASVEEAYKWACSLEASARLVWLSRHRP